MTRIATDLVTKRADAAWTVKDQWRDLRMSAYELALPMRNLYSHGGDGKTKQTPGVRKMNNVFDSTLMTMTLKLANRLQNELTPPFMQWAKLVPGAFIPKENHLEIQKKLDRLNDALFAAIHVSNFDTAINEFYLDLTVGTGVMMVMKGDDDMPIRYVCVPQAQVAFEEGAWGGINGVYRRWQLKARLVEETWKAFQMTLPDGWAKILKDDPERELNITEATYYDPKEDIWYYDVIWNGSSSSGGSNKISHSLVQSTFVESPWIIARWVKVAGETEGRGPVLFALPDAKTLNKLTQLVLMNASIAVSGVWTAVDDGVLNPNTVKFVPGAVIPVARNGGALGSSLQSLSTGADFNVAALVANDLKDSIKKIMMDSSLPPEQGTPVSATEMLARIKELQSDIGSPFGRLMTELIRPLIQKTLNVMGELGIIPIEAGKRIKVNGGTIDVKVQSPLAQSQNLVEVETAVQWFSLVGTLGPEATLLGINVEDAPQWLGEKMGVDPVLIRTREQRSTAQKMIGAMAAQQQQGGGAIPANDQGGALPAVAA